MSMWDWISNKKPIDISLKKRMENDVLVIYGKTLEICYMNEIAEFVVELSDGRNSVEDIIRQILLVYDIDENELKNDILDLIRELQWKRLIKLVD